MSAKSRKKLHQTQCHALTAKSTHIVCTSLVLRVADKGLKLGVISPSNGEETTRGNMIKNLSAMKFDGMSFLYFLLSKNKLG